MYKICFVHFNNIIYIKYYYSGNITLWSHNPFRENAKNVFVFVTTNHIFIKLLFFHTRSNLKNLAVIKDGATLR